MAILTFSSKLNATPAARGHIMPAIASIAALMIFKRRRLVVGVNPNTNSQK
ncbi:MAG: hypothetical protein N2235_20120 [Fischerella sp.]|nr:hypothetical protein [Fischerella sp.]